MHVQSCCFACFFPFTLPSQSSLLKLPILGLQPRDKAAMLGGQYNRNFARKIYMEMEFSSQRRDILLFLTTNMAAVTSLANQ